MAANVAKFDMFDPILGTICMDSRPNPLRRTEIFFCQGCQRSAMKDRHLQTQLGLRVQGKFEEKVQFGILPLLNDLVKRFDIAGNEEIPENAAELMFQRNLCQAAEESICAR